jgi:hypothetical protein
MPGQNVLPKLGILTRSKPGISLAALRVDRANQDPHLRFCCRDHEVVQPTRMKAKDRAFSAEAENLPLATTRLMQAVMR